MPKAYYNEIDPYAAQWLRNLIAAGHIAPGDVDERSIEDVRPNDLAGYTQCHFFAGIGVWSHALRRTGWPDSRPVWTGSCPCQPFSAAGQGNGFADERHLWPAWFHLISQCDPDVIFGEQVKAAIRHGWLDLVQTDLEGIGYAFAPVGIPAAGVGSPHIRARAWFVADSHKQQRNGSGRIRQRGRPQFADERTISGLAHTGNSARQRSESWPTERGLPPQIGANVPGSPPGPTNGFWRDADWLLCRDGKWRPVEPRTFPLASRAPARVGRLRAYGNAIVAQVAEEVIRAYMS